MTEKTFKKWFLESITGDIIKLILSCIVIVILLKACDFVESYEVNNGIQGEIPDCITTKESFVVIDNKPYDLACANKDN